MNRTSFEYRRGVESWDGQTLADHQLQRLNDMMRGILPRNRFYHQKLANSSLPLQRMEELYQLPYTYKDELVGPDAAEYAANLTFETSQYVRYHQTSGTRGRPMVILDTAEDWQWWIDSWQFVLDAAGIEASDRVFLAFSFGPFIGFWSAYDAAIQRGALVVPGGGLSTVGRLEMLRNSRATALFCTPSYALHMAEVAAENQIDIRSLPVRCLVVAGEPGGSVATTRRRIETAWNARVVDHSGASEIGPWGYADSAGRGLHIIESEFIAEFRSLETGAAAGEAELSELVLTSLGRLGSPVIRYRTGDLVRPSWNQEGRNRFVFLEGGVLGRVDDMMIIRGVNIFPSSIEHLLHSFPEIIEYRLTAHKTGELDALTIEIEDRLDEPQRVEQELKVRLGLNVEVRSVPVGQLPRFVGKGKRFIDNRPEDTNH